MKNSILQIANNMGISHNVVIRVLDEKTHKVISQHEGHNAATNSMLVGIAHYLQGDGVFNQGKEMLMRYVPQYISLGTMGLHSQDEDANGLPLGIGDVSDEEAYQTYAKQCPGYGADGYDGNDNNERPYFGIGKVFADRPSDTSGSYPTCNCELISDSFPRSLISYREIIPETQAELPDTIDIVYSALISTGALAQFREPGSDHIFITEAGLWARPNWPTKWSDEKQKYVNDYDCGDNGLLAGYRLMPPDSENWDMSVLENRELVRQNIIRVGINQIVQVIWKIQIGSLSQLGQVVNQDIYWQGIGG